MLGLGPEKEKKIFASRYKLLLPSEAELKAELLRELKSIGPAAAFRFVEVGTPDARRPPHRSRRAVFPHRALQINSLSHAPAGLPPVAGSPAAVDRS
jgi:hypothetical protein